MASLTHEGRAAEVDYSTNVDWFLPVQGNRRDVRPAMKLSFRAWKIYFFVFLFALQVGASGQTSNEPLTSITSALQGRDFQRALELLRPALEKSPRNPQLWVLQGLAYSGVGNSKSALASYKQATTILPDYLPALEGAAQIEYEAGSADAVPLLRHILKLRPDDTTSHAMLAVMAEKKSDCATAVENYAASGALLHSQPEALQGYGMCLLKLNETDKAILVFQQLVDAAPENPRWRRGLAAVQLASAKPQDAIATLQPLLAADPDVSTMRLAAAAFESEKDTPSAVKILRDAIVKDPRQIALYADFAEIALDHQSFQAGVEMIDAGIKLQPDAAPLYLARGVLYVQLAEYENAEADFEKAEHLDPKMGMSAAAQSMLAEEKDQKDPERALETVRAKLAKQPGDAFLWYLQAAILSQKSPDPGSADFQRGLDSAKRAVALQPSLEPAHNVLAKYYLDSGQNALAAKECRLVLEKAPSDQSALYHLVMALRKTKDQTEIPDLLKRLAKARQDATRQEGERNRYKLVVTPSEPSN